MSNRIDMGCFELPSWYGNFSNGPCNCTPNPFDTEQKKLEELEAARQDYLNCRLLCETAYCRSICDNNYEAAKQDILDRYP